MSVSDDHGFDYDGGLFEVDESQRTAPEPKEQLTRTQQYHRRVSRRIGGGIHPLGEPIRLHALAPRDLDYREAQNSDSTGPRCGDCRFRELLSLPSGRRVPKCHLPTVISGRETYPRDTASETSDVASWWPACTSWEKRTVK